ncbi:MAG TPA: SDR family oxidoreductase [Anaerolineales bacterium]|nr:SDR family oxidoreductase [Anaerolineales bacterium]
MEHPILVIGASGNVGAEVVRELQTQGRNVRAADIDAAKLRAKFGSTIEAVHFDFSKPETYPSAFEGVESMFLMRPPQISDVKKVMFPALDAAKKAGVQNVVFLSLIGIEKAKYVPHYKVETYLTEQGFQTTFLRCSFFMQNLNTTHRAEIQERNEIFVPVGNAKTSFIDVRDIGAVATRALTEKGLAGRNYDLTGGEALDYWQAASILSETLGREIKYRNPGALHFLIETLRRGASFPYALVVTGLYMSTRFGMAKTVTNEVERLLGRKPISFKQYTEDYREAWL